MDSKRYKADGLIGSGSGGDLVSIDRLQAAIAAVGRVCLPSRVGSCCLVSLPNLAKRKDRCICILTNAHVIPTKEDARRARIEFEETNRDLKTSFVNARLEPDDFFVSNKELDFTLVAIELSSAGKAIIEAAIDLNQTVDIGIGDVIHIVQHPSGGSKQISSQCVTLASGAEFECTADAMPGSSGSPVFSNWQLAGIVYALRRDTGASCCTTMRAILKFIGAEVRPEVFLNKHRTLFKPEFPGSEWEWVKSPSQLQPIDLWLPHTIGNQECVLLLGIPKGTLRLRTSALESKLPVLLDSYKDVSGTSALVTKERIVTLTSSTSSTVNFRLKVLQVSSLSVPASRAVRVTFGEKGSLGKEWFCIRNCKGKQLHIELLHVGRSDNDIPVCFLSAHSKDDLIVAEETEKMSHLGQLGQAESAVITLHSMRDIIFVLVFWNGKSTPKFELTVRSAITADPKLCNRDQCTICKKTENVPNPQILMTPVMQPIVGPMYLLKIQRFSGNAFLLPSVNWISQPPVWIQWGNTQIDHSFWVTRRCQLMTTHSNSPTLVKTLRRELAIAYSLESPEVLLQFLRRAVLTQAAANVLAQEWNRRLSCLGWNASNYLMRFVELAVYWLDARNEYGLIEHSINGNFQKYSDAVGNALLGDESLVAGAFSHFTWCVTKGRLLLCNIQGHGNQFTHPVIHSIGDDLQQFLHPQNQSNVGITSFFVSHKCNRLCQSLNLSENK